MKQIRFYTLDITRFFAAFAVLLYHYTAKDFSSSHVSSDFFITAREFTKFGYLGVNIFFMLSGFVILSSALNRSCTEFLFSRATRIYPTYWACVTITAVVLLIFGTSPPSLLEYFANLTMLNDYIGIDNIDGVYWTLQAELKFYFCVFILIACGWIKNYRIWLTAWLILTILFLIAKEPFFLGWFITPYYSSYFIAGATFYAIKKDGVTPLYLLIIGISIVISSIYATQQIGGFIANPSTGDTIVAILCIVSFYLLFLLIALDKLNLPGGKALILLGGITYPLYLLHGSAGRAIYTHYIDSSTPITLLLLAISFSILALLVHLSVETKLSNTLRKTLQRRFIRK